MINQYLFKRYFILVIIFFQSVLTYAQSTPCTINLSYVVTSPANGIIDCNGGVIELQASGTGLEVGLISNDFNVGLGTGWIATGGSTVGSPCETSLDNTPYYWASTAGSGTPNLTTVGFDVSCGGIITFDMDYATQGQGSPCEGPDLPNEGVSLEYSTDGGATWTVIDYWDPNGGYDPILTSWNSYSYPIPIGAQTPNTQFQWIQNNSSGSAFDNWGIDNVVISAYSCNSYWYNFTSTSDWVDNSNQSETISSTSTYGVWYTDGFSDSCYAEVTIDVPPLPTADAGSDQLYCSGVGSVTIGADPVTSEDGATYTWDNGAGSGTIDIAGGTDNGQVTVSPAVTTTYELTVEANGCTETDQVVVTVDVPPTASNPAPILVECASALPAADINVVTDEADDYTIPPTVTYIGETVDVTGCPETRTRTYRVTDDCGNFVDVFQTITIDPSTNPVVPTDGGSNVNCLADAQVQPAAPAVNDQCGNALTPVVTTPADIPCEGTMDWVFTYTDCAGNTADWTYTYTIDIPAFTVPADGGSTVNCLADAQVQPAALAVNDQCGNALTPVVTTPADIPCEGTMDWVFTYTDCAGNTADWTYTYTIDIPAFTVPVDGGSTVNCLADAQVQPAAPAVNDQCGNALTPVVTTPADIPCEGTMDWVFTYTDCAGNIADWTYTYTIDIPAFTVPADGGSTVNCLADAQVQPAAPAVNDQCGNTLTPVVTTPADIPCEGTMDWIFTYTDCAGNTVDWTYTYTIDIPVFTLPADGSENVVCIGDVYVPTPPVMNDGCGNPITPVMSENADPVCIGDKIYTFTYTDCVGNTADWTYTFSINDNVLPTGTAPADIIINVGTPIPPADPTLITDEADNCAAVPTVVHVSDVSDGGSCPEIITRTYEIEDACGNTTQVTQLITIGDIVDPTASNPLPVNIECIFDVPAPDISVVTDEADNSGIAPVVAHVGDASDGQTCPETITRTYSVTDVCGNQITVEQVITVNDVTAPTATAPATVNVECIGDVPPADINIITDEADNCTAIPVVAHVGDVSDGLSCPETITRTYSVTDDCGNVTTVDQLIIVNDVTPPTATAPSAITVECISNAPADINLITDEADNCTVNPVVAHVGDVSNGQSCPETITRTYSITDDCGNSITVDQLIIVNDITPPTASNPAPISVPGAPLVPAPDPSVVIDEADNCIVAPTVTWVSDVSDGNICNMEVITRTYSIMDDCGNEIFVTQEITIEAVPPPIDAGLDTLICSDGMATLTADNPWGVPISWDNGVTDGVPFSPNGNAVYTVTADNYGCISTDDVTVTIEQIPTIMFSGDQLSGCEPLTVTFINNSLAESAFDNCVWEFSNGTTLTGCSDVTYTFENGGLYDVTLTTTTVNGCVNSDTYTDYVYVEDIPLAGFIPNSTIISNLNPEINFVNTTADAAPGTAYSWTFGDGSPIIYSESPTHLFPEENSGSYEVEMIATSPLGCIDTAYGYVRVVEEVIFYVPNTFTPDSDNFNEYFQPIFTSGYDPYDFNLFIFNRWGEIIWESHDASVGWDGTYGGKLVQDGTYTWTIEFKTSQSDERIYVNGHLNVIK